MLETGRNITSSQLEANEEAKDIKLRAQATFLTPEWSD